MEQLSMVKRRSSQSACWTPEWKSTHTPVHMHTPNPVENTFSNGFWKVKGVSRFSSTLS